MLSHDLHIHPLNHILTTTRLAVILDPQRREHHIYHRSIIQQQSIPLIVIFPLTNPVRHPPPHPISPMRMKPQQKRKRRQKEEKRLLLVVLEWNQKSINKK